ncbi:MULTISPECIES: CHASE2 domain-containing protein [Gammaproteobacteria]|uniref:CHASE2 domain-containing protein n=1 Tax=Gammaproteobacteria TaxID=1236 RepID=UPI000DCFAB39|nr:MULTISPECIES: adenylate/guanylate cyclase domain-containing protein [Gammaproteobacteria]RTE87730.1 adenylate/guanylate cyclase domain-containing protein [Aliidiomarina sp. B3213]TCZ92488.1 adenylate/guanylate cyclase domain-containing protein [Lysobacter sp. N42]
MAKIKKHGIGSRTFQATISLIILFWVIGEQVGVWSSNVLQRLEWLSFDERVVQTLDGTHDPGIVIVDIDEKSLQEFGQWPWPRAYVARLVYELFESYQIQLLGLDVIFAEPESNLLATQWQQLRQSYPNLPETPSIASGDAVLGNVLMSYPTVSAFYFDSSLQVGSGAESQGVLPPPLQVTNPKQEWQQLPLVRPTRFSSNNEEVQPFVMSGGYFDNPLVDEDGVFRRVPLFQVWQDELYPSLPLAMFSTLLGQPPANLDIYEGGGQKHLEGVDVGGFYFPTDPQGAVLVPWFGTREHFDYISASDVLFGEVPQEQLAGKIVLLGTSAPGLMDLRSTPVGAVFPGVEIHASILAGMLQMNFKSEPGYSLAITLIALLITGLLMTWYYPRLSSVALLSISTLLTATHLGVNLYAWQQGLVLPLASGLLLLLLLTGWHLSMNFWRESLQKRQVAEQFGRYIPPELVTDIVASPEAQDMLGQEKELTVLFSDVRGFTSFSENIPPAELTEVMNRLLTPVTKAIHNNKGTIDKYMGDAVMAFWGAPLKDQQHAIHALEGALAMQDALKEINDTFVQEGKKALAMGIGVHTGLMNVGNMGSEFRMAYTVLGDNVNLGSRLEGLTKGYGVDILFSESTLEHIEKYAEEQFVYRKVDRVRVKGREAPLTIYELMGYQADSQASPAQVTSSNKALACYEQGQFKEAKRLFREHLEQWPNDKLAKLYVGRCKEYIEEPPGENWDGVFTHKTK